MPSAEAPQVLARPTVVLAAVAPPLSTPLAMHSQGEMTQGQAVAHCAPMSKGSQPQAVTPASLLTMIEDRQVAAVEMTGVVAELEAVARLVAAETVPVR